MYDSIHGLNCVLDRIVDAGTISSLVVGYFLFRDVLVVLVANQYVFYLAVVYQSIN